MNPVITALQTAVTPVILISGLGLLLLTMTNRLGRTIDRARALSSLEGLSQPDVLAQIDVLLRRAKLLRTGILFAVLSALTAGFLVIALFLMVLFQKDLGGFIVGLFIISMTGMIGSLALLMRDVNLSLSALEEKLKARR